MKRKSRATQWNGSRRSGCRLVRARLETKARFFSHWPFPLFRPGIRLLMRLDVSGRGIPRFTRDLYRAHLQLGNYRVWIVLIECLRVEVHGQLLVIHESIYNICHTSTSLVIHIDRSGPKQLPP